MMGPVYEVLKSEYQRQQEEGFCVAEVDGMTNFIFTNRFGNPHNPQAVNRAIKRIVDTHNAEEEVEAKKKKREPIMLPRFSCHIFRHTFASRFCENETNVKVIQEVMGHADVSTTMNIYAEANPEVTREALEKLAKKMCIRDSCNHDMRFVTPQGNILRDAPYKGYYGVRPAFYLNTENYTVSSGTGQSAQDPYVVSAPDAPDDSIGISGAVREDVNGDWNVNTDEYLQLEMSTPVSYTHLVPQTNMAW